MTLLLLLACTGVDGATDLPPPPTRPNFLVIDIDSLRADRVLRERDGAPVAPTLARLAREGRHHRAARSQSAWTLPAAWALLTGRFPLLVEVQADTLPRRAPDGRTLPEILSLYGYRTAAWWGRTILADGSRDPFGFGETFSAEDYAVPLADWIAAGAGAPFFAFVHNLDLHLPAPPFPPEDLHRYTPSVPACAGRSPAGDYDALVPLLGVEAAQAHIVAHYDGALHAYDTVVADLLDQLDRAGAAGSTVVVLTSDHGEELFERGAIRHGVHYAETLDIPLVVRDPAGPAGPSDLPVQTIDFAPSVLARAGIPADQTMDGRPYGTDGAPRDIFSLSNRYNASLTTPSLHLLLRPEVEPGLGPPGPAADGPTPTVWRCHDRQADPTDRHPLDGAAAAPCAALQERLTTWVAERLGATDAVGRDPIDPEQKRLLRERGYWDLAHPDEAPAAPARPARRKPHGGG